MKEQEISASVNQNDLFLRVFHSKTFYTGEKFDSGKLWKN